jgi:hypothetical protein
MMLLLDNNIITFANGWDNFSWHAMDLHKRNRQSVCLLGLSVDLPTLSEVAEVVAGLQPPLLE